MFSTQACSAHRNVQYAVIFSTQACSADRHVQYAGIFSTLACSAQGHVQYTGMFSTQVCSGAETAILDTDYRRTQTSVSLKSLRPPEVKWTCTGPTPDGQTLVRGGCLYSLLENHALGMQMVMGEGRMDRCASEQGSFDSCL